MHEAGEDSFIELLELLEVAPEKGYEVLPGSAMMPREEKEELPASSSIYYTLTSVLDKLIDDGWTVV
jgi:hypothetical protein